MLTGLVFDAATAQSLGLVYRVGDAAASIDSECEALRRGAPEALRTTKRLARQHAGARGRDALAEMAAMSVKLFRGAEAAEGMAAFAAHRPPAWAGP